MPFASICKLALVVAVSAVLVIVAAMLLCAVLAGVKFLEWTRRTWCATLGDVC
jgi:hypothetical protein